jgi:hypothetical protein
MRRSGSRSRSEYPSLGRTVTSADDVLGSSVRSIATADAVDVGWRFCMERALISRAVAATVWPMQASKNRSVSAVS